ncbi:MAG: glycosyltransferase family 4 protein [Planctomycetota bacterium]|nr:glycosyltransferase family 4 protein [Planctomycetota bacterium]
MHVALVIEAFDPGGGGAERSTLQIAQELVGRGHQVTILTGWARGGPPAGVRVEAFRRRRWKSAWLLARFASWARGRLASGGFDTSLSVTTSVPAAVVQPRSGTIRETLDRGLVARGRAGTFAGRLSILASPKRQALLALERRTFAAPSVKQIVAVSRYVSEQLTRHYAIDPSRVVVIPNAARMPAIDASQRDIWRARLRESFHIPPDAMVYLFAALNPRLKGYVPLLKAFEEVRRRGVPAVMLLAGEMKYPQQHLAAEMGLRESVRFIGPTERMAELYCAADVTVLPTFYDPSSKVVIESLMMGTPAISTAFNGASDFIVAPGEPVRGRVLADPADHLALATAMMELADPQELARCRAATQGLAERLSMKVHVDRLEEVLREAAGR